MASPAEVPFRDSWAGVGDGGGGVEEGGVGNDDDAYFAADEVEAAYIMYEAFRATKGPDGQLIDTDEWSVETELRVQVRGNPPPTHAPSHAQTFPGRNRLG